MMAVDALDRFIAHPDVRERFETTIRAPAPLVMEVAQNFDLQALPVVRSIFRLRELLLGANKARAVERKGCSRK